MTLKPYSGSKGRMQLAGLAVTVHKAGGHRCCSSLLCKWSPCKSAAQPSQPCPVVPCGERRVRGSSPIRPVAPGFIRMFLWPWALSLSSRSVFCL